MADFGCNDGKFLKRLTNDPNFSLLVITTIFQHFNFLFSFKVGVDIDEKVLELGKIVKHNNI